MEENIKAVKQLTNSLKKLNIAVEVFTQKYYESVLTSLKVNFTYINEVYRIKYYVTDKYHNKNYTLITTKKLNSKLINTILK